MDSQQCMATSRVSLHSGASCSAKVLPQREVRSAKVETWPQEALEQFLLASLTQHEQAGHHYLLTYAGPRKITLGS